MPIGFDPSDPNIATTLLYSGEQFDQRTAMQYLRARYYNPSTGTRDAVPGILAAYASFIMTLAISIAQSNILGLRGLSGPVATEIAEKVSQLLSNGGAAGGTAAAINEISEDLVKAIDDLFE